MNQMKVSDKVLLSLLYQFSSNSEVKAESAAWMIIFLYMLPQCPEENIEFCEEFGKATVEWFNDPSWTISISIGERGDVYWSALLRLTHGENVGGGGGFNLNDGLCEKFLQKFNRYLTGVK